MKKLLIFLAVSLPSLGTASETNPQPAAEQQSADCETGRVFNAELGQCLLEIPQCSNDQYLDQASLQCVSRPELVTAETCRSKGMKLDQEAKSCVALEFADHCRDSEKDYEFMRTVSWILNSIEATSCDQAQKMLEKNPKLNLSDPHYRILDLEPLRYLTHLKALKLNNQGLVDIDALEELKSLEHLELANNDISDISALGTLEKLRHVDLRGNPLESVATLKKLPQLIQIRSKEEPVSQRVRKRDASDKNPFENRDISELKNRKKSIF